LEQKLSFGGFHRMASVACRQLSSTRRHLTTTQFAELSRLERDIQALVTEGVLEAFEDERGVIRYRPVAKPIASAA
jgi:hypothetical protein